MLFEFAFKSSKLFVHSISLVIASATFLCAAPVVAQSVTLTDEKVIAPLQVEDDADDHYLLDLDLGLCRLSPDGRTLLTVDAVDRAATQSPAKLAILRLESLAEGGKRRRASAMHSSPCASASFRRTGSTFSFLFRIRSMVR